MADPISSDIALVEVRQESGRWRGYITVPWFRYLSANGPAGNGAQNTLLHGNPGGAPTWSAVDLEADVVGVLPFVNGGLGGVAGSATEVLHGGAPPSFSALDLAADVTGTLPVAHGGTGVTTSTGAGNAVLSNGASMLALTVNNGFVNGLWDMSCPVDFTANASIAARGHIAAGLSNVVAINNAGFTDLCGAAAPLFFCLHDRTSGGVAMGLVDPGGISLALNTTAGINITFDAITLRLKAQVTAGASPRNIGTFIVSFG